MSFILEDSDKFEVALRCVQKGDFRAAEKLLREKITEFTTSWGYAVISEYYSGIGELKAGQESLKKGIYYANRVKASNFSNLWKLYIELGCCGYLCGDYDSYESCINKGKTLLKGQFIKGSSTIRKYFFEIAQAQEKAGDVDGAIQTQSQV